jgi:low affinity Fe/Cu permease
LKKNIITIEKNHKSNLKDKIKNYKNFDKRAKEKKIKKSKVEEPNQKTSYTLIGIE